MMMLSHTAVTGRGHFLMKHFLADGLAMLGQSPGPHVHLMSHPRTATLRARLVKAIRSIPKGMLIRTSAELDRCLHVISVTRSPVLRTEAHVKVVS